MTRRWLPMVLSTLLMTSACAKEQQHADLGELALTNGQQLKSLNMGYRTFGTLTPERDNAVVLLTWFGGQSEQVARLVGEDGLIDPDTHFVILIDALANGVSSSPSTSASQPRAAFPVISIADMVAASKRLLEEEFALEHVHALVGLSMGGMQVFEWIVHDPEFADRAVIIQGSPRLTPHDLLLWQSTAEAIRLDPAFNGGNYTEQPARRALYYIAVLSGQTPAAVNRQMTRDQVLAIAKDHRPVTGFDANDHLRQVDAMLAHDVARNFEGDLSAAAKRVTRPLLFVWNAQDHVVRPEPGLEFAASMKAEVLELPGDCGHGAHACELPMLGATVRRFLENSPITESVD